MKNRQKGKLVLEDGTEFEGYPFGAGIHTSGEVVFNTGMVGYPESLTDPSYHGQILVLTYPLVGNYGVHEDVVRGGGLSERYESERVQVAGLVVGEYSGSYSHWSAKKSLGEWLAEHRVPALTGVDTRAITKRLREKGVMLGRIAFNASPASAELAKVSSTGDGIGGGLGGVEGGGSAGKFIDPNKRNLASEVSIHEPVIYGDSGPRVVLVDCGVKHSIIRSLIAHGVSVRRVPWDWDISTEEMEGLVISNGPGDPKMCADVAGSIKYAMKKGIPVLGICLGSQLLALAAGADTYKLKYGHRGQNQPCIDMETGRCYITSQNHGYAVDERTLPRNWEPWFRNANDDTNEGIKHRSKPFFGVQFHPEANPGPVDTAFIFDAFRSATGS